MANELLINQLCLDAPLWNSLREAEYARDKLDLDFRGADLSDIVIEGFDLRGANFQGAKLDGAYFIGCDLRCAIFENASAIGTRFDGSDMTDARFASAEMPYMSRKNVKDGEPGRPFNLENASLKSVAGITREMLAEANLNHTRLPSKQNKWVNNITLETTSDVFICYKQNPSVADTIAVSLKKYRCRKNGVLLDKNLSLADQVLSVPQDTLDIVSVLRNNGQKTPDFSNN